MNKFLKTIALDDGRVARCKHCVYLARAEYKGEKMWRCIRRSTPTMPYYIEDEIFAACEMFVPRGDA